MSIEEKAQQIMDIYRPSFDGTVGDDIKARKNMTAAIAAALREASRTEADGNHTAMYGAAIQAVRQLCNSIGAHATFIDDCVAQAIAIAYERGKTGQPLQPVPDPTREVIQGEVGREFPVPDPTKAALASQPVR